MAVESDRSGLRAANSGPAAGKTIVVGAKNRETKNGEVSP